MKKRSILGLFFALGFILIFTTPSVHALPGDDFKKEINTRLQFYATNYEAGNDGYNYAQFLVYMYSVEKDVNAILRVTGDFAITPEDISSVLGEAEYTNWVFDEIEETQIEVSDAVSVWTNKIVYDGISIQIKVNVVPYQNGGEIVYKATFEVLFKDTVSEETVHTQLEEIERLAKVYSLEESIEGANALSEEMANAEFNLKKVLEQSADPYETLLDVFGKESLFKEEEVASKTYEIYSGERSILATVSSCVNCKGVGDEQWIVLDMKMKNENNEEVAYYYDVFEKENFADVGINGLKAGLIQKNAELNDFVTQGDFASAYQVLQDMEALSEIYSEKINEDKTNAPTEFVLGAQFYAGLFEGYPLVETAFYEQQTFRKILYVEENETLEICTNNIDDDQNGKIDCQEEICAGQVCGTQIVVDENGTESSETLYCIAGACVPQEEDKSGGVVCGDGLCSEGETCQKDCGVSCEEYGSLQCAGNVMFKGVDANGCPLEPICIEGSGSCNLDADCEQPLCGKSECVLDQTSNQGKCVLTKLNICLQPKCTDGERMVCSTSGTEVVTAICKLGQWEETGSDCAQATEGTIKESTTGNQCTTSSECSAGMVCSAGACTFLATNTKQVTSSATFQTAGVELTGFVIDLSATGENVKSVGNPITGVVPEPSLENEDVLEKPTSLPPPRSYETAQPSTRLTGIVGTLEGEEIVIEAKYLPTQQPSETIYLDGAKEAVVLEAVYTTDKKNVAIALEFFSVGEKFGGIGTLLERYRTEGAEWQSRELTLLKQQTEKLSASLNNEFARWYLDEFLSSQNELSTKKQVIYDLYEYDQQQKEAMARIMENLKLVRIAEYENVANIDYTSTLGSIKSSESLRLVKFAGMKREVELPILKFEANLFYPAEYVKENLRVAMDGNLFLNSQKEREYNFGMTDEEKKKFASNKALQEQVAVLVAQTKDGSYDVEVSFVDSNGETLYNLFVSLEDPYSEHPIKMYPIASSEIPSGKDARIQVGFDALYNALQTSEEGSWRYTQGTGQGFSASRQIRLFMNWAETQTRLRSLRNAIDVTPNNNEIKDMFMEFLYTFADQNPGGD